MPTPSLEGGITADGRSAPATIRNNGGGIRGDGGKVILINSQVWNNTPFGGVTVGDIFGNGFLLRFDGNSRITYSTSGENDGSSELNQINFIDSFPLEVEAALWSLFRCPSLPTET